MRKRPAPFTKARKAQFLAAIREGLTLKAAAAVAGVSINTAGDYFQPSGDHFDPAFADEVEKAKGDSLAEFERIARQRATEGYVRVALTRKGDPIEIHEQPSDKLLELVMRARDPQTYASHSKVEHTGELRLADAATGELEAMNIEELAKLGGMVNAARPPPRSMPRSAAFERSSAKMTAERDPPRSSTPPRPY
jgi:hypothetical protein